MSDVVYTARPRTPQAPTPGRAHAPFDERLRNVPYEGLAVFQDGMNAAVATVSARLVAGDASCRDGLRAIALMRHVQLSAGLERVRRDLSHPGLEVERHGEPASLTWLTTRLALGRIRSELSDRQIARLIGDAEVGDVEVLQSLRDDNVTVDDLQMLLRAGARR